MKFYSTMSIATIRNTMLAIGIALFLVNIAGLVIPIRAPEITDSYADFARSSTLNYDEAIASLDRLIDSDLNRAKIVTEATRIFHYGMAHISLENIKDKGFDHYGMRIPVWENYILYLLSYIKPSTYYDYEICSYKRALARGTGRCGQQSLALVSFLSSNDIETGFIGLGGHAIATAKVSDDNWYMLDPDYGGVIPFGLSEAEKNPQSVIPYYWNSAVVDLNMFPAYGPEYNTIRYGGPEARFGRACYIETATYIVKWAFPVGLVLLWFVSWFISRKQNIVTQ